MMICDLVRNPRRAWLWGLFLGGAILCLNVFAGLDDSDLDQWIAWGIGLGGLVAIPLVAVDGLVGLVRCVKRKLPSG